MSHYELIFLVHPDQSEQASKMIERYCSIIKSKDGKIHRLEDWGRKQLSYPINKLHKAHYFLMNIECSYSVLKELKVSFRFNDAIIRNLILSCKYPITKKSVMMNKKDDKKEIKNKNKK
jgi:small subunit ribosomal protein S6